MTENSADNCCMETAYEDFSIKKEMIFGKINNEKLNKQVDRHGT